LFFDIQISFTIIPSNWYDLYNLGGIKLKRILILLFVVVLSGCSNSTNGEEELVFGFTVEDFESRVEDVLKQMGEDTNLQTLSSEVNDDGRHVITLSKNIMMFIDSSNDQKVSAVSLGALPNAYFTEKEDLLFSLLLLVGTVDDSLNAGERSSVLEKLKLTDDTNLLDHTSVYKNNGIEFIFKGSNDDNIVLQAIPTK